MPSHTYLHMPLRAFQGLNAGMASVQHFAGTGNRIGIAKASFVTGGGGVRDETRTFVRGAHYLGDVKPTELRLMAFGWFLAIGGVETNVVTSTGLSVDAAIEIGGTTVPVTWSSAATGALADGTTYILSDPLTPADFGLSDLSGVDVVWRRMEYSGALGDEYPHANTAYDQDEGEFAIRYSDAGKALLDPVSATGVITTPPSDQFSYPSETGVPGALIGSYPVSAGHIAIGIHGDSIAVGTTDTGALAGFGKTGGGPVQRGLWDIDGAGARRDWCSFAVGGSRAAYATGVYAPKRAALYGFQTHVIVNLGTNDFVLGGEDDASIRTALRGFVDDLGEANVAAYHTGLLCRTTSSDAWATLANQSPTASDAERVQINADLAADVGGYWSGLVDWTSVACDVSETDKWAVTGAANYATTDGVHPSPAMIALLKAPIASWADAL